MPLQLLLPGFPDGASRIGDMLSILKKEGRVTYFVGGDNYFSHGEGDASSHRFILASLMENGHVRACDLEKAPLCIAHRTLMNWLGQLRAEGPDSFFRPSRRAGARVMTPEMVARCEGLFARGLSVGDVAKRTGILESTLRKALGRGALSKTPEGSGTNRVNDAGSTKSQRSRLDAEAAAGMGTACTRADERVAAATGLAASTSARFEHCDDVAMGGLLVGLPALCANGLFSGIGKHLSLPKGFYRCLHILLTLGFMALARIRRPEGLRHIAPGELGKVAGLDRVPEVRTLREKITAMASSGDPDAWMKELARTWMEDDPDEAGYLYVDGHVRVYYGKTAHLPRRYVSRERLCLRGTTDYWVNDALGRPFFVVSKTVTDGLASALRTDIVPELLACVPGQPAEAELKADPLLHRFVIVFDREGATHSLLAALWDQRIASITYRKNVTDTWPQSEFVETEVPVPGGAGTPMMLARRETELTAGKKSITVMEVRRLMRTGHQTAVISTARRLDATVIAGRMFARWCQENYFSYMMQHFDIDGLVQYGAESLPGTVEVINPAWRTLDKAVKTMRRTLQKFQAELGIQTEAHDDNIHKKAECVQNIQSTQGELEELCAERKKTKRKVPLSSLPEEQRPTQLLPLNKILTDTVKMIAYRAETALVALLLPHLKKEGEARALVRELLVSSADIEPDDCAGTLTVRIHRMASPAHDTAVAALLDALTRMEFCHPETKARMSYTLT
jgi:Transposase protein